jgi:peptidoglycan/LPS O-acetylase OafA/YrhL
MQKKIEVIDFLKGYSMLSIVIYHIGQELNLPGAVAKMINFGGTGVHTFIFVSGFGLYLSHLRRPLSFVLFLRKRF